MTSLRTKTMNTTTKPTSPSHNTLRVRTTVKAGKAGICVDGVGIPQIAFDL